MVTLYYSPGAASLVVHWFLLELGIEHELVKVDTDAGEQKQPVYLAINPQGMVPAIVIDGQVITEAAGICMHLADRHAGWAPPPGERAAYYQWMCFCTNQLQPAYRAWFYPWEPAGEAHVDAVKAKAQAKLEAAWAHVETQLTGTYVLGEQPSAVDLMMTMMMRWSRNMPRPAHTWPRLGAYAARMKARPAFREMYAREGLTEWS